MRLLIALMLCFSLHSFGGTIVPQQERATKTINDAAENSNSVPDLKEAVKDSADQIQLIKDALVKAGLLKDD